MEIFSMKNKKIEKQIEIKKCKDLIKELFPNFEFLKKWNDYSIVMYEDLQRIVVVRKPNLSYKLRSSVILPFIFLPYSFWYGFVNVKRAIRESYKGSWVVTGTTEEAKFKRAKEYYDSHNKRNNTGVDKTEGV